MLHRLSKLIKESDRALKPAQFSNKDMLLVMMHELTPSIRILGYYLFNKIKYQRSNHSESAAEEVIAHASYQRILNIMGNLEAFLFESQTTERENINLNILIKEEILNLFPCIIYPGLKINIKSLPLINANRQELITLFRNLIENAYKHSQREETEVTISSLSNNESHIIKVSDNGIGMSPDQIKEIFNKKKRGRQTRKSKGYGIGLYLCKKIMQCYGGKIESHSSSREGASFSCYFPKDLDSQHFGLYF